MGNFKGPGGYHWSRKHWMPSSVKKTMEGHCIMANGKSGNNHVDCPKGMELTGGGCRGE
eukprot:gene50432-10202_t